MRECRDVERVCEEVKSELPIHTLDEYNALNDIIDIIVSGMIPTEDEERYVFDIDFVSDYLTTESKLPKHKGVSTMYIKAIDVLNEI